MKANSPKIKRMELEHTRGRMVQSMKESTLYLAHRFLSDMRHGNGVMRWQSGQIYSGEWY